MLSCMLYIKKVHSVLRSPLLHPPPYLSSIPSFLYSYITISSSSYVGPRKTLVVYLVLVSTVPVWCWCVVLVSGACVRCLCLVLVCGAHVWCLYLVLVSGFLDCPVCLCPVWCLHPVLVSGAHAWSLCPLLVSGLSVLFSFPVTGLHSSA